MLTCGYCCVHCMILLPKKKGLEDKILVPKPPRNCARTSIIDDNTNIVNAPQEPFVGNQDPGENSSPSPPHIDHCCHECGDSLEGIFCRKCTCKSCGEGAHYGYNCPPKVPIISNPELPNNQTVDEPPQSVQQQCLFRTCQQCGCNEYDGVCFYCKVGNGTQSNFSTPYFSNDSPSVANHPPHHITNQINSLSWGDELLTLFQQRKSVADEVIKSSVEDLVPIPSEPEGIPDSMCDVPLCNNPTSLEAFKEHSETIIDSNDDSTSSDDDSYENIDYVDASPPDDEIVSLEVVEIVDPEVGRIDDDILLTIKDNILREKLLNVNLLIAKIDALRDNPTPSSEVMIKSTSTFPNLFLEETNTFDNSIPESETFRFNLEEISSGSPTTRSDLSLPDYKAFYDSFIFDLSNDQFPPADRSDFYHEKFADGLTHIISPPEYDHLCFKIQGPSGISRIVKTLVLAVSTRVSHPQLHFGNPLPVKYLGVPLISSRLLNKDCKILVEKARNRIGDWKNKSLSFAGRLQLCKSVISSMQVYWASVLVLPKGIIYDIQQLIRCFLWCNGDFKRGKAKVAWEDIFLPKHEGVLLRGRTLWDIQPKSDMSWGWHKILQLRDIVKPFLWVRIGNGMSTSLWYDMWFSQSQVETDIHKRTKNKAKDDKTEHGMEKREKTKSIQSQSQPEKS
ncbi:hypothetical protein Tco_0132206 [Tanacetum coccineum]